MISNPTVTSALSFAPLTADDLADIHSMFNQTVRGRTLDERDLRQSMNGNRKIVLTRRVLPAHT